MDHEITERDGVTVLHLHGPIDVSRAMELRDLLGAQIDSASARVLVDLSDVSLIDSSGIGILVTAHRRADGQGARFGLAGAAGTVARVFEMTRTNKLLSLYATVDEGVAGLGG
ncbi:MAG: anti-sigma-factor antagonist [Solirubrobacteraceae bacterium]|nr:anti-sigma-factor antagonist [Solirubrobacteraceae bacterium]